MNYVCTCHVGREMDDPERFQLRAVRLYAMALKARDTNPKHAGRLIAEAIALQDRAACGRAQLERTAYREAGRAVLGRVLTLVSGPASIQADHDSAGHSMPDDSWECESAWKKSKRTDSAVCSARIITFMAGVEAVTELLGRNPQGDGNDRDQISRMMEELAPADRDRCEARLRAMTRMLVRRYRRRIERVAHALLAKTKLSAKQLDKLTGCSVDDVTMRHVKSALSLLAACPNGCSVRRFLVANRFTKHLWVDLVHAGFAVAESGRLRITELGWREIGRSERAPSTQRSLRGEPIPKLIPKAGSAPRFSHR